MHMLCVHVTVYVCTCVSKTTKLLLTQIEYESLTSRSGWIPPYDTCKRTENQFTHQANKHTNTQISCWHQQWTGPDHI